MPELDVIRREDDNYRRGVLLGLTMAEIIILLIFCLLIAMVVSLRSAEERANAARDRAANLERQLAVVENSDQFSSISNVTLVDASRQFGVEITPGRIDDDFLKLVAAAAENEELKKENEDLENELHALNELREQLEDTYPESSLDEAVGLTRTILTSSGDLGQALADAQIEAQNATYELQSCVSQMGDKDGQLSKCRQQLSAAGGKGLEKQSCWWDKTSTPWSTRNIFDVALTDQGLIIRDLYYEDKVAEKATMPLENITFESVLSDEEFLRQTRGIYEYAERNECVFFVRRFDETGPTSKGLYKQRMQVLERHFYYQATARPFNSVGLNGQ